MFGNKQKIMQRKDISAKEGLYQNDFLSKGQSTRSWLLRKSSETDCLWIEIELGWKDNNRRNIESFRHYPHRSDWRKRQKSSRYLHSLFNCKLIDSENWRKNNKLWYGNNQRNEKRPQYLFFTYKIFLSNYFWSRIGEAWNFIGHDRRVIKEFDERVNIQINKPYFVIRWSWTWKISTFKVCSWFTASQHLCKCNCSNFKWINSNFKQGK